MYNLIDAFYNLLTKNEAVTSLEELKRRWEQLKDTLWAKNTNGYKAIEILGGRYFEDIEQLHIREITELAHALNIAYYNIIRTAVIKPQEIPLLPPEPEEPKRYTDEDFSRYCREVFVKELRSLLANLKVWLIWGGGLLTIVSIASYWRIISEYSDSPPPDYVAEVFVIWLLRGAFGFILPILAIAVFRAYKEKEKEKQEYDAICKQWENEHNEWVKLREHIEHLKAEKVIMDATRKTREELTTTLTKSLYE